MPNLLTRQSDLLKQGQVVARAITANTDELPHLQLPAEKMEQMMEEMGELLNRQALLAREKQEASRRIQELYLNGIKLLSFLRKGVQENYGTRNEKLAEFGLKVYRGRPRLTPEPQPVPTPEEPEPNPPAVE